MIYIDILFKRANICAYVGFTFGRADVKRHILRIETDDRLCGTIFLPTHPYLDTNVYFLNRRIIFAHVCPFLFLHFQMNGDYVARFYNRRSFPLV